MPDVPSFLDRLLTGIARLEEQPPTGTEAEAVGPLLHSLKRTAARVKAGIEPGSSMFRYQVTGGKALMYQGTEALPIEPTRLVQLLNAIKLELQAGEVLDIQGTLAAWVIRPEANLTESNLRQADNSVRMLNQKHGRDRDHAAAQAAETTKVRLRGRLTQLVSALQVASSEAPQELPDLGAVTATTPKVSAPTPPPPPPKSAAPPPPKPKEYPVTDDVLAQALERTLAAIHSCGFKAVGLGALAHRAWGSEKPMKRIEIMVGSTPSQRDTLLSALRQQGLQQLPDGRPLQLRFVNEELGAAAPVDLSEASTPPLKQLLARAQTGIAFDQELEVASSEDLILQRISSDVPGDVDYAVELLRENLSLIDGAYLKKEAQSAGILDQLKEVWQKAKAQMEEQQ
jgi:hypothetical protein